MTGEKSVVDNPASLTWAVWLLYLEFAGLAGLTVALVVMSLTSGALNIPVAVGLVLMSAIGAVAVFFAARGLARRARGARGPSIGVQLFVIAAGGFLVQVHPVWLGVALMVLGAVAGGLIVTPSSTRALGID